MAHDTEYMPLFSGDSEADVIPEVDPNAFHEKPSGRTKLRGGVNVWVAGVLVAQSLVIVLLSGALWTETHRPSPNRLGGAFSQVLYSPAQDVLEPELKTFTKGVESKTIYEGEPGPATDNAWKELYDYIIKIPKSQAALLANHTSPVPGDQDNYVISLSAFHQLHCLNILRQGLNPEHYTDPETGDIAGVPKAFWKDHTDHCIDNLRQGIMCAVDVTPLVWQWNDERQKLGPRMDVIHSCRNFDNVKEWAKAHSFTGNLDNSVHIKDDLVIPIL